MGHSAVKAFRRDPQPNRSALARDRLSHGDALRIASGHAISARPDYGYGVQESRRKVLLWSREPWEHVDDIGDDRMPPGRYVSGVTRTSVGEVTVVGLCIPWSGSRVGARYSGERRRVPSTRGVRVELFVTAKSLKEAASLPAVSWSAAVSLPVVGSAEAPSEAAAVRRSLELYPLGAWTNDVRDLVVFPQDAYPDNSGPHDYTRAVLSTGAPSSRRPPSRGTPGARTRALPRPSRAARCMGIPPLLKPLDLFGCFTWFRDERRRRGWGWAIQNATSPTSKRSICSSWRAWSISRRWLRSS